MGENTRLGTHTVGEGGRFIVVSDVHGKPWLIENALKASGFREGIDRLVVAGDIVDRGPDEQGCIDLIEEYGAIVLWGNHDIARLIGYKIAEQDSMTLHRDYLLEKYHAEVGERWELVACFDGVLVSHAGISKMFAEDFEGLGRDAEALTDRLNLEFRREVDISLAGGPAKRPGVRMFKRPSPYRYRWSKPDAVGFLEDVVQVAGHDPASGRERDRLSGLGLHITDPSLLPRKGEAHLYAAIEAMRVRLTCGE